MLNLLFIKIIGLDFCTTVQLAIIIGLSCMAVLFAGWALDHMNQADVKYCMEQTTYEYNDCIVKIQG